MDVLFLLNVTLFKNSRYCLSPHNILSQIPGFIPSGFAIFFFTGGSQSFHLFCSPIIVLKSCSSSLCKCNACTVCFFQYLAVIEVDCLFPIMLGRLNARTRFRAMAEASIPLSSISLGETSHASQPVEPVRI